MAEMWRYDGSGVARKAREVWRYDAGGIPRKAREIWRYDPSGIARKVFSGSFVLTASAATVWGSGFTATRGASVPVTTSPVTLTVQGGAGVFTYAWATLSGSAATAMSPNVPTQRCGADYCRQGQHTQRRAAVHGDGAGDGRGQDHRRDGRDGALVRLLNLT
jgi:hypothetical protein